METIAGACAEAWKAAAPKTTAGIIGRTTECIVVTPVSEQSHVYTTSVQTTTMLEISASPFHDL
ncbi:MAG: hypothetical protein FGM33_08755 [Candidatus Kapabacteria bacterium]|nr:hypothetical protein [Candidatus Kapabacteria bacterium]